MKILVTGAEGYIGSELFEALKKMGHDVTGIDAGYYRDDSSELDSNYSKSIIREDIRNIAVSQLNGFDAVIHLADLSNDPLGKINENVTRDINFIGAVSLAKKAKKAGVARFLYSSSCSVYGNTDSVIASEASPTSPQTMYAKCKLEVENELQKIADSKFSPVILRNATVYGPSRQMRFDLVVNKLVADAYLFNTITINNGGTQWRPSIHILDVCYAFISLLSANKKIVHSQIFNVGHKADNYTILQLGNMIKIEFPDCKILEEGIANSDKRSYKVSFDKIYSRLPGFKCNYSVSTGIKQLHQYYKKINLTEKTYTMPRYTRLKQINYLLQSDLLDDHFYWNKDRPVNVI